MTKVMKSDNKSDDKSDDNEDFTISSSNGGGEFKFLHLVDEKNSQIYNWLHVKTPFLLFLFRYPSLDQIYF